MAAAKKPSAMAGPSAKALREADLVMGTNNSSIVSKRSVEMFYYPKPHFFRSFVKKPQRRAPLINRGYWLRMYAMLESVQRFMREPSDRPKFVLNLGCGFDPLPFMLLSSDGPQCRNTTFVDIDYEKLMVNKKTAIQNTPDIIGLLEDVEFLPNESAVQIRSDQYVAIGCDLKNLSKLEHTLKKEVFPSSEYSVLCLAEVSLTYMDVKSADAVVNWAARLNDDVQFCILEQFFPDGPNHPFASTMMKHFNKLGAPLYSIHEFPSLNEQEQRFKNAGWTQAKARSLWDLWSDDDFLSPSTRTSLDAVEPFDEWEEFALFASHYFLLHASTRQPTSERSEPQNADVQTDASTQFELLANCPPGGGQRRFGALIADSDGSLGHHGGLGRQTRLASTDLYTRSKEQTTSVTCFPRDISARMCHTVTNLSNDVSLLVGGRNSPASVLQDCWLRRKNVWRPVDNLPTPSYRHSAVKVSLANSESVLVFGGKTKDGQVLDNWALWSDNGKGWTDIEITGSKPTARFGACLASINDTSGVLFGGIESTGTILNDFWTWELSQNNGTVSLNLRNRTRDFQNSSPLFKYINRFGATLNQTLSGLVIIGGIIPEQVIPLDKEIMIIDVLELQTYLNGTKPWSNILSAINLSKTLNGPRPLLTGHVSSALDSSQVLILGGGAVCFSFGTFWTEGTWLLKSAELTAANEWGLVPEVKPVQKSLHQRELTVDPSCEAEDITSIPRVQIQTEAQFRQILANGKPVVIEGADIGPCKELWTKEYLADAVGSDRKVVVHEAGTENMNFQTKNFSYITKPFGVFLDEVHAGGRQYLRSISTDQPSKLPANFGADFPSLKDDFRLPEQLSLASDNAHSSPLRISGSVTMWLHYDVMANVLCQIRGQRRLVLFPPSDVQYLHIPAGASSSPIDLFQNKTDGSIVSIPHTSPQEATLKPGDILFLPPLWLHTASPTGQVSVAVNIFFRNLDKGYAAGRDVYGNRDLQAYEKSRNDVQKIARSFEGLPHDMARFYLLRLAQELKDKAEV